MLLDTSKPGWKILHADCEPLHLSRQHTEGQSLWDVFAVPDVVRRNLFQACLRDLA